MTTILQEELRLLKGILETPAPRWHVWMELKPHGLGATEVRGLIAVALATGHIYEADGLLHVNVNRTRDILL
jgi:hypothetical protein